MTGAKRPNTVVVSNRQRRVRVPLGPLRTAASLALCYAGPLAGPVSVVVVADVTMRRLNAQFTGSTATTDVLAFDLGADCEGGPVGEVIVNAGVAETEAALRGRSVIRELSLYVVHGILHLAGYRDKTPAQIKRMRAAERAVMAKLPARRGTPL